MIIVASLYFIQLICILHKKNTASGEGPGFGGSGARAPKAPRRSLCAPLADSMSRGSPPLAPVLGKQRQCRHGMGLRQDDDAGCKILADPVCQLCPRCPSAQDKGAGYRMAMQALGNGAGTET
eukprot:1161963-Pelagomonas_calceolata.AAC.6